MGLINCVYPNFEEGISTKWNRFLEQVQKSENIAKRNSSNSNPIQNVPKKTKSFFLKGYFLPKREYVTKTILIFCMCAKISH
jgi:hypothetical protein